MLSFASYGLAACILPNFLVQLHGTQASLLQITLVQVTNGLLLALLFLLIPSPRHSIYLFIPLTLLSFFLADFLSQFGGMPSVGAYGAILSTNLGEASGYLRLKGPTLLACLVATTLVGVLLRGAARRIELPWNLRKRALAGLLLLLALLANGLFLPAYLNRTRWVGYSLAIQSSFPLGFLTSAAESVWFLAHHRMDNAGFRFHATRTWTIPGREVDVLVIGESSSAAFWSLDGYPHPTNPKLQQYRDAGSLLYFPYTLAQANATQFAVPMIVTAATPNDFDESFREKSLVTAFREAGFATYWITNQDETAYAGEAEFFQPLNQIQSNTAHSFDEDLWPALDSVLASRNPKLFIVLHMIGSHTPYADRVPPTFQAPDPGIKDPLERQYARTIAYTDEVLDGLIRRLDRSGGRAFLWFVSDHGQVLRAGEVGHGSLDPSVNELHIPMLFWSNGAYRAGEPAALANLRRRQDDLLSQGVTFPTILGLAGVTYPGLDQERDLSSPAFDEARRTEVFSSDGKVARPRKIEEERRALEATRPRSTGPAPVSPP